MILLRQWLSSITIGILEEHDPFGQLIGEEDIIFCDDRVVLLKAGHAEDSLVMRVNLSGEIEGGAG
jgi:hypothetical protein